MEAPKKFDGVDGKSAREECAAKINSIPSSFSSLQVSPPVLCPPSHQPQQLVRADAAELKRRREQKGKDVVDAGKTRLTHEEDAQRAAK